MMSEVRVSVEHNYKDVKQLWSSQDYVRNTKVRKVPTAFLYKMSALLTNFRVCLYNGGQISTHFDVKAPLLDEYLATADTTADWLIEYKYFSICARLSPRESARLRRQITRTCASFLAHNICKNKKEELFKFIDNR